MNHGGFRARVFVMCVLSLLCQLLSKPEKVFHNKCLWLSETVGLVLHSFSWLRVDCSKHNTFLDGVDDTAYLLCSQFWIHGQ